MSEHFKVTVLASGSKGNSTLIVSDNTAVLIDAGISCRRITKALEQCGLSPQDLSGVLITHEHTDHVGGLTTFTSKYDVPIFANEPTWLALSGRKSVSRKNVRVLTRKLKLGNLKVEFFPVSHDAAAPVGYCLYDAQGHKCTYLTDCGCVEQPQELAVQGAEALVLESNHDVQMLREGSYPPMLQRRILGRQGHLSNLEAAELLAALPELPEDIFLAHLSQENNTPKLALQTVKKQLNQEKSSWSSKIYIADQELLVSNYKGSV